MPKYFPLLRNIENSKILLIGANQKAEEKLAKLKPFEPDMVLIDKYIQDIPALMESTKPSVVIVADEDLIDTEEVYKLCKDRGIDINVVDNPKYCTFIFPSMLCGDNYTISVSTNGKSPTAAIKLREAIEDAIPQNTDDIVLWLNHMRTLLKQRDDINRDKVAKILRRLADVAFKKDMVLTDEQAEVIIKNIQ